MGHINSQEVQELLIHENVGLVASLAKSFNPPNSTEYDEYVQAGYIGLWKAAEKYDPGRGNAFSTMAWYCIRNEIIRYIKREGRNRVSAVDTSILINQNQVSSNDIDISDFFPSNLSDKEINVVYLRMQGHTFGEIGQKIGGISKGGASNIYKQAVNKIRVANIDE